jgi:hypothetical protein
MDHVDTILYMYVVSQPVLTVTMYVIHSRDEIGRERQVQRQGAQRAEARAELSVELAQARILAGLRARALSV